MKIFVAIPVYDAKLPVEVVRCLLNEQALASGFGDDFQVMFLPSCSHAAMGRNQLTQNFLDSDADRLFFLDADVTFEPGAIVKLANAPVDFVGGAFRYKFETENYPVGWLTDRKELWADKNGYLEVATLPGGFLSLSREVFRKLKEAHPEKAYSHFGKAAHCFFEMAFRNGALYGEDSGLCQDWRDIGGKVYLSPEIELTHWDFNVPYKGHIGKWLKGRKGAMNANETSKIPSEVEISQNEISSAG